MAEPSKKSMKNCSRPALTEDAQEKKMIALAVDLAEQQLIDGTASAQVITHYLKLGSSKEKLEQENLAKKTELMQAKKESLQAAQRIQELYAEALDAFQSYSGHNESVYDESDC